MGVWRPCDGWYAKTWMMKNSSERSNQFMAPVWMIETLNGISLKTKH